jgi:DNA-binding transcriptional regulator YhcF (GntR family)
MLLRIDSGSTKPIYVQIAEGIEDDVIAGLIPEGAPVYSQLTLSRELRVNPATAAKGINMLVNKGVLERQRGQSMTVAVGARARLLKERREDAFESRVRDLLAEARKLGMTRRDVEETIKRMDRKNGGRDE